MNIAIAADAKLASFILPAETFRSAPTRKPRVRVYTNTLLVKYYKSTKGFKNIYR